MTGDRVYPHVAPVCSKESAERRLQLPRTVTFVVMNGRDVRKCVFVCISVGNVRALTYAHLCACARACKEASLCGKGCKLPVTYNNLMKHAVLRGVSFGLFN